MQSPVFEPGHHHKKRKDYNHEEKKMLKVTYNISLGDFMTMCISRGV